MRRTPDLVGSLRLDGCLRLSLVMVPLKSSSAGDDRDEAATATDINEHFRVSSVTTARENRGGSAIQLTTVPRPIGAPRHDPRELSPSLPNGFCWLELHLQTQPGQERGGGAFACRFDDLDIRRHEEPVGRCDVVKDFQPDLVAREQDLGKSSLKLV